MAFFFKVQTLEQVHARAEMIEPHEAQRIALSEARGRTLAETLCAPHDLPGFPRATMDGYAVLSQDTFGASETSPAYLTITGEVVMGRTPDFVVSGGGCGRIGTGGMLPEGADAVMMVEHTRLVEERLIEVTRAVAPGAHVLGPTDDAACGQPLLPVGHLLRPQDIGLLAALGITDPSVFQKPRVGVISSGDEVIPITASPVAGQIRDVNSSTLMSLLAEAGALPVPLGIVGDELNSLRAVVRDSLQSCDLTLLSGGSSVGTRDLTVEVFTSFARSELLVHGVSVAPGKPFVWVKVDRHHLLGLPGQVASCIVAFHLFVEPMLERMLGRPASSFCRFVTRTATLTKKLPASPGRETFFQVSIAHQGGEWLAEPLFGKSGLIRTLIEGRGIVRVPFGHEGLDSGAEVTVLLYP